MRRLSSSPLQPVFYLSERRASCRWLSGPKAAELRALWVLLQYYFYYYYYYYCDRESRVRYWPSEATLCPLGKGAKTWAPCQVGAEAARRCLGRLTPGTLRIILCPSSVTRVILGSQTLASRRGAGFLQTVAFLSRRESVWVPKFLALRCRDVFVFCQKIV